MSSPPSLSKGEPGLGSGRMTRGPGGSRFPLESVHTYCRSLKPPRTPTVKDLDLDGRSQTGITSAETGREVQRRCPKSLTRNGVLSAVEVDVVYCRHRNTHTHTKERESSRKKKKERLRTLPLLIFLAKGGEPPVAWVSLATLPWEESHPFRSVEVG